MARISPVYALGVIILFAGWFYALLPHAFHQSSGLGLGLEHTMHTEIGIALVLVGLGVLIWEKRGAETAGKKK